MLEVRDSRRSGDPVPARSKGNPGSTTPAAIRHDGVRAVLPHTRLQLLTPGAGHGIEPPPVARATVLIRRPVAEVFDAFVDPAVATRFRFDRATEPVVAGPQ